jgi:alkanesulfonate monooxygenase SsuD/methylene tetrahydromethanopterin reductase-like flavin-dependent oxidoreductase (luciferase family)
MRFGYHATMCHPTFYAPLAKAAEELGFNSLTLPDSICYPEHADSKYPYNDDGSREFLDGVPFIEPFTLVPWMAAVTTKLKFSTSVMKLPIRNPVLVAKSLTSMAVLIGEDRFIFGVGLSPWEEDFAVTQTDYHSRGKRMDQMIEIIRGLSSGDYFGYESEFYHIPRIKLCPTPTKPVPILYGSHSDAGLKRAARLCDGWISAGGQMNELSDMIGKLKDYRKQYGREGAPFDIQIIGPEVYNSDSIKRLEDMGANECLVGFRNAYAGGPDNRTLESMIAEMGHYVETVMRPVQG